MATVLIAVACIALLVRVTLWLQISTNKADEKEEYDIFVSSALHLINDFKTHQHGIILLDGAEVIERSRIG